MRVLVVADDSAYPCNSGGRQALAGDLRVLRQAADELEAIFFHRGAIAQSEKVRNESLADRAIHVQRRSFSYSLLTRPLTPYQTASRQPGIWQDRPARPDIIIAEHDWSVPAASDLRDLYADPSIPLVLRSHNDEKKFLESLARNSNRVKGAYYRSEARRLSWQKPDLYDAVQDIWLLSWQDAGAYPKSIPKWLFKPVLSNPVPGTKVNLSNDPAIVFIGALDMAHTVKGLLWFLENVWPTVSRQEPGVRLVVAGRNADPQLERRLRGQSGVNYLGEVAEIAPLLDSDCVYVNPVFDGSGVNMKLAMPASYGRPIVSTDFGLRGLRGLADGVLIANDDRNFEQALMSLVRSQALRHSMGKRIQHLVRKYDVDHIAREARARVSEILDREGER